MLRIHSLYPRSGIALIKIHPIPVVVDLPHGATVLGQTHLLKVGKQIQGIPVEEVGKAVDFVIHVIGEPKGQIPRRRPVVDAVDGIGGDARGVLFLEIRIVGRFVVFLFYCAESADEEGSGDQEEQNGDGKEHHDQ